MELLEEARKVVSRMHGLYDSPVKEIMERTELSRPTVSKFFNLEKVRPSSEETIYELCLDLIEEKEVKRKALVARSKEILEN